MEDKEFKDILLVYFIFGVSDYVKIKIEIVFCVGVLGEFIGEKIKFGWIIMFFGKEVDLLLMFFVQILYVDYDNLCKLDVLGLVDLFIGD